MKIFKVSDKEFINLEDVRLVRRFVDEHNDYIEVQFTGTALNDWEGFEYTDDLWNRLLTALEE